jgi:hypothetical protein
MKKQLLLELLCRRKQREHQNPSQALRTLRRRGALKKEMPLQFLR